MERVEYHPVVIQDLWNYNKSEELDLNPWYQRRSVWTRPQKAYLINTLLEQKPVPSIYIRHYIDLKKEKSIKEVVDGQQRLRSIFEFLSGQFKARHPEHDSPVAIDDFTAKQKSAFLMTSLSVGTLIGADVSDVIEIFGRLNSVAKTLNLQERRNARFSGEFKQFCLKQAAIRLPFWRSYGIFSANDIARMTEVQFMSELAVNMLHGLSDYSTRQIDATYNQFEESFPKRPEMRRRMDLVFAHLASLDESAIKDTIFSRPPLFFTLFLLLDEHKCKIAKTKLEEGLFKIDEIYNSDTPPDERAKTDAAFYIACTSNMHRIKSRKTRRDYIRKRLGLSA